MISIQLLQKKYSVPRSVKRVLNQQGDNCSIKAGDLLWKEVLLGKLHILSLPQIFEVDKEKSSHLIFRTIGEICNKGEVIARKTSFFSFLNQELKVPADGIFESYHEPSASIFFRELPTEIPFYSPLSGTLYDQGDSILIESRGLSVQGAFGEGHQCFGTFQWWTSSIKNSPESSVPIILGLKDSVIASDFAPWSNVKAVIAASLCLSDIKSLIERGISVIVTEGIGSVRMSSVLIDVLDQCIGKEISLFPQTKVYAGAIRPMIFCSEVLELQIPEREKTFRGIRAPFLGVYGVREHTTHESIQILSEHGEHLVMQKQNVAVVFTD